MSVVILLPEQATSSTFDDNNGGKTRKRTRNLEKHKSFQQKSNVQRGLEHKTKSGNIVKRKTFQAQVECVCKKKCAEKINVKRQNEIFETYYKLKDWSKKMMFLRTMVKVEPSKPNLNPVAIVERKFKYHYFLINENGEHKQICHRFFLKCLQVSSETLYRSAKSVVKNESATETRGKFPTRKTSTADVVFLKHFIRRLPSYYSHYGASKSEKKFLDPNLNIRRLYKEYCKVCQFEKRKEVSEWKFRHIFNTQFNLGFHPKKVDTCRTCDRLVAQIKSEQTNYEKYQELSQLKDDHLELVKITKQFFFETIEFARSDDSNTEVFTFDLQRALELPSMTTSEAFYKRKLWCYNLCIFDEKRGEGHMYFWNESIASRGAQEVSSCLIKHTKNHVPVNTVQIILYSDSCLGQNKNIKTTLMMKKILDSWPNRELKSIEQRFFVSGHSYNSCDRCFGTIEKQKRRTEIIFTPQHWINIIKQAKKNEPKFTVTEMKREDFFSCEQMEAVITNRKKSIDKEKVSWLKAQKIINNRSKPFDLTIEPYSTSPVPIRVSLRKRDKAGKSRASYSKQDFIPLYSSRLPIPPKKHADLMQLLQYIPQKFHEFYLDLKCGDGESEPKRKRD